VTVAPMESFLGNAQAGVGEPLSLSNQSGGNSGHHRICRGLLSSAASTGKVEIYLPGWLLMNEVSAQDKWHREWFGVHYCHPASHTSTT